MPFVFARRAHMRRTASALTIAAVLAAGAYLAAQGGATRTPFKLGTFERQNHMFVGLSVRDSDVADLAEANAAFEGRTASAPKVRMPADMKELISRYDSELKERLGTIAADLTSQGSA